MACYGNDYVDVPNLNRLADESFVFENTYVSQPVCSPSRATLLTGTYPHTARVPACNIPLPEDLPTIAEMRSLTFALPAHDARDVLGARLRPPG